MNDPDFVEKNYERIATDPDYRARLLAEPVALVSAAFGYTPGPDLKIEIIEQVDDTVVIMVPPKPGSGEDAEIALNRVTEQVLDLLFSSGIGGFFIPDDTQKWVLREMRLASMAKTGSDGSQP